MSNKEIELHIILKLLFLLKFSKLYFLHFYSLKKIVSTTQEQKS